jgi:hypothetical protein
MAINFPDTPALGQEFTDPLRLPARGLSFGI